MKKIMNDVAVVLVFAICNFMTWLMRRQGWKGRIGGSNLAAAASKMSDTQ